MALNYPYRLRTWLGILASLRPADWRSRKILWASAAGALLTSFRNLDAFQKPMPLGDLEVDVAGIGRFAIRAGTDDLLHLLPAREQKVRETIEQRIRPGTVFVDGGANIGFYSILAARLAGPDGRVVAFEMMPDTAAVLRRHIAANGATTIEVIERALSDRSGSRVRASVEPGQHGQASIVNDGSERRHSIEVETITLDEALADCGAIDLIKLDLEGAEYVALQGAAAVLARTACVVFESNERDERIFDLLISSGFIVEHLEGSDFLAQRAAQ
jgi:FkbM family methyltransferase